MTLAGCSSSHAATAICMYVQSSVGSVACWELCMGDLQMILGNRGWSRFSAQGISH